MSPIYVPGKVVLKKESVAADPYYNNVSLLLHGNGANGSTAFVDSGPTPKTLTPADNAQISTAIADPFGNNTGVIALDGNGDFLSSPSDVAFSGFNSTNWTLEAWIYVLSAKDQMIINLTNSLTAISGLGFSVSSGNSLKLDDGVSPGINAGSISMNTWTHVAASRNSGTTSAFINGTLVATSTQTPGISQFAYVGRAGSTSPVFAQFFNGYIDELRITKGIARYTSNFAVPTAPFPEVLG